MRIDGEVKNHFVSSFIYHSEKLPRNESLRGLGEEIEISSMINICNILAGKNQKDVFLENRAGVSKIAGIFRENESIQAETASIFRENESIQAEIASILEKIESIRPENASIPQVKCMQKRASRNSSLFSYGCMMNFTTSRHVTSPTFSHL